MSVRTNEELKKEYFEKFGENVSKRYSQDNEWILKQINSGEKKDDPVPEEEGEEETVPGSLGFGFIIQKNVQFRGRIWKEGEKIKASELGDKVDDFKKREIIK